MSVPVPIQYADDDLAAEAYVAGYEEGDEEGYERGYDDGYASSEERADALADDLARVEDELTECTEQL